MKTPTWISKLGRAVTSPLRLAGRVVAKSASAAVGQVSWNPPRWLRSGVGSARRLGENHPRATATSLVLLLLLSAGGISTWRWYVRQPKPHRIQATIVPIPTTPLEKDLRFPPLVIRFSEPAARLDDLKKPTLDNATIEPRIAGAWHWENDSELVFVPVEDWPAGQKYRISFRKELFARHALLERLDHEVSTPAFQLSIEGLELYQDPTNPALRQITATIHLSHAVEPGELERHAAMLLLGGSTIFAGSDPQPHFAITYGLHRRLAYVRSSAVTLPEREDFLRLVVSKGVRASKGGSESHGDIEAKLRIPSVATFFKVESATAAIARNKANEPEQILVLATSANVAARDFAKATEVWLLPKRPAKADEPDDSSEEEVTTTDDENAASDDEETPDEATDHEDSDSKWQSAANVPEDVLADATKVELVALPSDKENPRQHAFRVRVEAEGELYVRVNRGVRAVGDYPLCENYETVVNVPRLPREIQIEGEGGVLAIGGERKLSIRSRGLPGIEYEIGRVATTQINHLVSQTEGKFQHPDFQVPGIFDEENIARIALQHQPIAMENKWKPNYSAFDFSEQLRKPSDGGSERGLFFINARGWDPVERKRIPSDGDRRFVLVTDLALVTKHNTDGSSDVFVMSIQGGRPVGNVTVELIGKNGVALHKAITAADGHATFQATEKAARDRKPVAFIARSGDDVSFIPYKREDRILNFSRFDIDGAENLSSGDLDAFVFTERGVYRPGDDIHIGIVVKQRNWHGQLTGLPIETEVRDARDLCVQTKKITLPETGFIELNYQTTSESPSGSYQLNTFLVKNNKRSTLLGSTTVTVKEFLPDRMKIETRLSASSARGWIHPQQIRGEVSVANLYGTPAADRRVLGKLELAPGGFGFPELREFTFFDPTIDDKKERHEQTIELGEKQTADDGRTSFDLDLERFADATYAMRFLAEAFEADGGRSVAGETAVLVSDLPFVVGSKADGDLRYIELQKPRAIGFIAVDPQLTRIAVESVTVDVTAEEYVSVLTREENGNFVYQSVLKQRPAYSEKISISADGLHYALRTAEPGNYVLTLRDDQDRCLNRVRYSVVGHGAATQALEKNAELDVKLQRTHYNAGEEVAISVTAPYAGSGLITIERDKVYAYAWFQTNSATSVQHIRIPEGFDGSGYINVTFVRALNAKEISVSPLSYGVAHFTANEERRRVKLELTTPEVARPGEPLHIRYKADRACKLVVFAVDEGILQVTDYKAPNPLAFFFRKCALGVETAQIVDLILPEFSLLRSVSAYGGGGDAQHLNPFKRVTEKPVVYWSGIIDAGPETRELIYEVPDFFDGALKVMAVAIADSAVGSAERETIMRGPLIITPTVPVLAAPGDEFEAGVTVANNVQGSGTEAQIQLRAETSEHLSIIGQPIQKMHIAEGREATVAFRFKATEKLGSGEIRFVATGEGAEVRRRSTLSVRPPMPYSTEVHSGSFNTVSIEVPVSGSLVPEFRKLNASISALPLGLAHGLDAYLHEFPHGCSEQITSGAFARLLLSDEADFGLSRAEVNAQLEQTFGTLRRRQNDQGAFGYWAPENGDQISFVSVYVMDFLSQAKAAGFAPPAQMFATGLRNLQTLVGREPSGRSEGRIVAYGIYVLTREGVITTNYILNLRDHLDKEHEGKWKTELTGVYLAASLKLLHLDKEAESLIGQYDFARQTSDETDDFCQPLGADSQYIAILARHFPDRLRKVSPEDFSRITKPVAAGQFNTLSAGYGVAALKAYSHLASQNAPELSIAEIRGKDAPVTLSRGPKGMQRVGFSGETTALRFASSSPVSGPGLFYQVVQAGFKGEVPVAASTNGIEVYRELLDAKKKPVTTTRIGESVFVRLHVRSLQRGEISNVAIVDLLPGGFEVVASSLRPGIGVAGMDYVDVREDRAVFYGTARAAAQEIDYEIKACNRGEFVVPPVFAESMYDRNVKGCGVGGRIVVTE